MKRPVHVPTDLIPFLAVGRVGSTDRRIQNPLLPLLVEARTESEEHRRKATSLLDEALAISSDLGMRPLMERVLSRRKILRA